MKRIRILLALSATLTVLAALCFVNNIVAVVRWWRAFSAAGGDTSGVPAHAPGCFAWLDWSAVDYSAVTTFIPLLGFLCMTRAAWGLCHARRYSAEDFPFFRGSDQLNVALGLFGTLWGIIVIGYFRLDTVQMADLMQCLHTALFSTLMAVVWVFLFDRPLVRPYFTRLLEELKLAETDDEDLSAAVDRLVLRLGVASDAFDARQRQYESAFEQRQAAYDAAFTRRQAEADAACERRQQQLTAAFEQRQQELTAAFEKRQQEADAALARQRAEQTEVLTKGTSELLRLQGETAERCERHLAEYERDFEKRQREYVEFFQRRIDELEKRAANAEAKLKAVVTALHE